MQLCFDMVIEHFVYKTKFIPDIHHEDNLTVDIQSEGCLCSGEQPSLALEHFVVKQTWMRDIYGEDNLSGDIQSGRSLCRGEHPILKYSCFLI